MNVHSHSVSTRERFDHYTDLEKCIIALRAMALDLEFIALTLKAVHDGEVPPVALDGPNPLHNHLWILPDEEIKP